MCHSFYQILAHFDRKFFTLCAILEEARTFTLTDCFTMFNTSCTMCQEPSTKRFYDAAIWRSLRLLHILLEKRTLVSDPIASSLP